MRIRNSQGIRAALALLGVAAILGLAAHAQVPGQVDFQGLLLDAAGDPVNGVVDLDFDLFDAPAGGTLLWTESHADVSVVDGVYDVALGSLTPLTPAVLASGDVYLEITVEGETLSPRRQLLAVPYALRASEADAVDGFSGGYFSQIIENYDFDGEQPPNTDPREGLGDPDGDGVANFLDPDNDDDGLLDSVELADGSDINLVTPFISGFSPPEAPAALPVTVTVNGTGFGSGLSVQFGSENPTPQNLTPTSFDVDVSDVPVGDQTVVVSLPNGESDSGTYPRPASLEITGFEPASAPTGSDAPITVFGDGFGPGLVVDTFGALTSLTPTNVTQTSFDVVAGPQPSGGTLPVEISMPNGETATSTYPFRDRLVLVTTPVTGDLGGLAGADALCAARADQTGLGGLTFRAWLADGSESPATRFVQSVTPYRNIFQTKIADDWNDLVDGSLDAPIAIVSQLAWGNVSAAGGTASGPDCDGWTSSSPSDMGRGGDAGTTGSWTGSSDAGCDTLRVVLCFEQ